MRLLFIPLLVLSIAVNAQNVDSVTIRKIYTEALSNGQSYSMLERLCKDIGPRLSGSEGAAKAVEWSKKKMEEFGFDRVYLQEVMVPHWVRGEKETGIIINGKSSTVVPVCALGGSIGTETEGITGDIIEVKNFDELKTLGEAKIKGKIVFFNRPMDAGKIRTFDAYSGAVDQRGRGAIEAAKYGALGVIVRSMTLAKDDLPHAGSMRYDDKIKKIPAAAISTNGADLLSSQLKKDPSIQFYLQMNCETLPDAKSYNVIGELKGTEFPNEVIVVGGHLDSWDLAEGAHDDGAGCVQSIEALRIFKALNIRPKRTIRAVMFMNEENGVRGGNKYAELAKTENVKHIVAIESDAGGFTPRGFGLDMPEVQMKKIMNWKSLLAPYGLEQIGPGHGGTDIEPLQEQGVALIGLSPDSQRYFDFHHAANDNFEAVNKRELELGAAGMASLIYLLANYGL